MLRDGTAHSEPGLLILTTNQENDPQICLHASVTEEFFPLFPEDPTCVHLTKY